MYTGAIQLIGFPEREKRGNERMDIISERREFSKAEENKY